MLSMLPGAWWMRYLLCSTKTLSVRPHYLHAQSHAGPAHAAWRSCGGHVTRLCFYAFETRRKLFVERHQNPRQWTPSRCVCCQCRLRVFYCNFPRWASHSHDTLLTQRCKWVGSCDFLRLRTQCTNQTTCSKISRAWYESVDDCRRGLGTMRHFEQSFVLHFFVKLELCPLTPRKRTRTCRVWCTQQTRNRNGYI